MIDIHVRLEVTLIGDKMRKNRLVWTCEKKTCECINKKKYHNFEMETKKKGRGRCRHITR